MALHGVLLLYWGVAKWLRHWNLTPAVFECSNHSTPAKRLKDYLLNPWASCPHQLPSRYG